MGFTAVQLIQLFLNLGGVVAFAILFWLYIIKLHKEFITTIKELTQHHREELLAREDHQNKERDQRENELKLLTEKSIETMTKLELLLVDLNRERKRQP